MTQTEIFQNMTKGEWKDGMNLLGEPIVYVAGDLDHKIVKVKDEYIRKAETAIADAKGIAIAVNNTYGKGINPESVDKMKAALEWIEKHTASENTRDVAKEALTAAKLS